MVDSQKGRHNISGQRLKGFWKKNLLTIIITAVNFTVAGITVYYNYFRVVDRLSATIVDSDSQEQLSNDSVAVNIAIFNSGNRQALLSTMRLAMVRQEDGAFSSWQSIPQNCWTSGFPIVIQPGAIALVRFKTPSHYPDFFPNAFDSRSPFSSDSTKIVKCVDLGIYWIAVNSQGKSFEGLGLAARLTVEKGGALGISYDGDNLDLYRNINQK